MWYVSTNPMQSSSATLCRHLKTLWSAKVGKMSILEIRYYEKYAEVRAYALCMSSQSPTLHVVYKNNCDWISL